jgi:hypothetical protein
MNKLLLRERIKMGRDIAKVLCSCGGTVSEKETTADEEKEYGCGRKGCCCNALQCDKCGVRFTLSLEAPELRE